MWLVAFVCLGIFLWAHWSKQLAEEFRTHPVYNIREAQ